jgi:gliding motility-associated-like protein
VKGDSTSLPGNIILTASGCPTCTYQWYDSNATLIVTNNSLTQPNKGNTLYYALVTDNMTGCSNMHPSGYPDTIYSYNYFNTVIAPPGDPSSFGNGVWNVYCYNNCTTGNDPNCTNYAGYYVDNTDFGTNGKLSIRSWELWSAGCTSNPAEYYTVEASPFVLNQKIQGNTFSYKVQTYQGNLVDVDHHVISYKRKSFPAGYYQFDIDVHWNASWVYINGTKVFAHQGYDHGHENIWWGYLDANSTVEFTWINDIGSSKGYFTLSKLPGIPNLTSPDLAISQSVCQYRNPSALGAVFPIEDSYIDSSSPDNNFGNQSSDSLINCSSTGQNGIFLFDLSNLADPTITSSILYFTGTIDCPTCFAYMPTPLAIYALTDTTWNEQTVTWNKLPVSSSTDTSFLGMVSIYQISKTRYQIDVSNYVRNKYLAGVKKVAFYFQMQLKVPYDYLNRTFQIISNEGTNVSDRPFLFTNATVSNNFNSPQYQWELDSITKGQNWYAIPNATDLVYQPSGLEKSTVYRLKVVDKFNQTVYSDTIDIKVTNPNGEINLSSINGHGKELKLINYAGSVKSWESSSDSIFSIIHPIVNSSDLLTSLSKTDLYYRAILIDNTCSSVFRLYPDYIIYNTISPNNDGYNDTWQIDGIEHFPENKVRIFNEWGQVVYQVEGYNNSDKVWKGSTLNSERLLPDGTYYYCIDIKDQSSKKGFVMLKR